MKLEPKMYGLSLMTVLVVAIDVLMWKLTAFLLNYPSDFVVIGGMLTGAATFCFSVAYALFVIRKVKGVFDNDEEKTAGPRRAD